MIRTINLSIQGTALRHTNTSAAPSAPSSTVETVSSALATSVSEKAEITRSRSRSDSAQNMHQRITCHPLEEKKLEEESAEHNHKTTFFTAHELDRLVSVKLSDDSRAVSLIRSINKVKQRIDAASEKLQNVRDSFPESGTTESYKSTSSKHIKEDIAKLRTLQSDLSLLREETKESILRGK